MLHTADQIELGIMRRYVAAGDVPCPTCRTPLGELAARRCPACGERLALAFGDLGHALFVDVIPNDLLDRLGRLPVVPRVSRRFLDSPIQ